MALVVCYHHWQLLFLTQTLTIIGELGHLSLYCRHGKVEIELFEQSVSGTFVIGKAYKKVLSNVLDSSVDIMGVHSNRRDSRK